jgi:uncharacterized short protein YbdD (DUF466 family)
MSHFTVLVIGGDHEEQLAPFSEHIEVDAYRKYTHDVTWQKELYAKEHPDAGEPTLEQIAEFLNERYDEDPDERYAVDETGLYHMSTYNPDSKWDWYVVGGRWRGFFKLTEEANAFEAAVGAPGVFDNTPQYDADFCTRGMVDAEAMRDATGEAAGKRWDRAHKVFAGTPEPDSWEEVRSRHPDNIDAARQEYGAQERVRAVREHDQEARKNDRWEDALLDWNGGVEQFAISREEFVANARDHAITPYAYLMDGQWFAPGEMGWWGYSSDSDDDAQRFAREFNRMFDELPPDTVLTLVDCHI